MTNGENNNLASYPKLTTKDYVGSIRYIVDAIENGPDRTTQIGTNTWYDAATNYPLNCKCVYNGGTTAHPEARVYGRLFDTDIGGRDAAIDLFASGKWTVEFSYIGVGQFGDATGASANCFIGNLQTIGGGYIVVGKQNGFNQLLSSEKDILRSHCTLTLVQNGMDGYIYINGIQKCHLTGCINEKQDYSGYLYEDTNYHCVRVHNRPLTAEEILHNYEVDKERFGV